MKAYGGVDVQIHIFLTSALAGGEWLASCPGRFTPGYPLDRKLGEPQSRSGRREEEKILYPSVVQSVASRYTNCAVPAPLFVGLRLNLFLGTHTEKFGFLSFKT
jgi:hypothetical protein